LLLISIVLTGLQVCYSQNQNLSQGKPSTDPDSYNQSSLGENVFVFDAGMDMNKIQIFIDTLFNRQI
jgi:hypothetical protein